MKQVAIALLLLAQPVNAQSDQMKEGMDLLSKGTRMLLEGLIIEMDPMLQELRDALGNLNAYHPPEVLPNGDIIIRRRTPLPPPAEGKSEGEEIEL